MALEILWLFEMVENMIDFICAVLIVTHPLLGQFTARKITDPEKIHDDTFIDRTVNTLERVLKNKGGWGDCPPAVFCKRVKTGPSE